MKRLAIVLLASVLLLPGAAEAQKRGGTLIMLVQPEPPTLAAYQSTSGPIGQVMSKFDARAAGPIESESQMLLGRGGID